MFSAVLNAQNKNNTITPITSVNWSITGNSTTTYTGVEQKVNLVSIVPSNASYNLSQTGATNVGDVAQSTLIGTNSFSGTYTSPTLTIVLSGSITDEGTGNTTHKMSATLLGATATSYAWSKVTGTGNPPSAVAFTPNDSLSAQNTTATANAEGVCSIQCVISYSGGTFTVSTPVRFGPV